MKRYGSVIKLRPEKAGEYIQLHQAVWPDVLKTLQDHHVKNYSIFLKDNLLFSYLEYHGDDYAADMAAVAENEATQRWWKLTAPCQETFANRNKDEWWASMEEVFHMD